MNKPLLKFTALLLILAGIASSCNPEIEYPIDVSFTEYSLLDTDCQWTNLSYNDKVLIISSTEELKKYISCTEGSFPAIDFSKHTLLLASGKTANSIYETTAKKLQQLAENNYQLEIETVLNSTTIPEEWCITLVVSKISENSSVGLNVTCKDSGYPIDIPFEVIPTSTIFWQPYPGVFSLEDDCFGHDLIMINSFEEMEAYFFKNNFIPDIDFSKYTLLLARCHNLKEIVNYFIESFANFSPKDYSLKILIDTRSEALVTGRFEAAILTGKLNADVNVELIIEAIE